MAEVPVIEVADLWLKRNGEEILEAVNLRVFAGDVFAIIGPNGGGKTTLIKVILGLIPPDRGTVRILGGLPQEKRHLLGYVPQLRTFDFHYPISVRQMILSGLLGRKTGIIKKFTAADTVLADKALATMGIAHLADRPIRDLSGGEQQRAVIARALVGDPQVLLLDEPTVFVDAPTETQFYDILKNLARSMTIVMVTHDIGVIVSHVTKVACLNRRLFTHDSRELTEDMIQGAYQCPVDIIAHGHPHRVLREHAKEE
ncbi:MAG: ABC transporter [Methanomicrobiales archaeon HGW-Methanomicrobiales-3]|jgi:zinc transport system ATP-binding protein|nr:MAG: ABC transporter [Methanomicrobiales archaeon HGW-Methanomicrobiales-3]